MLDYRDNKLTSAQIAKKYEVCPATLTNWALMMNVPLRGRGRRRQDVPTEQQRQILEYVQVHNYDRVGRMFGLCKQQIQRVVKRWKDWQKPSKPPFDPGDIIVWEGVELTVVSSSVHGGIVRDKAGKQSVVVSWSSRGKIPRKTGVNPDYVVKAAA